MAYSASLTLGSNNFISLSGYAPFQLSIYLSGVSLPSKVYNINYDFGDGTIIDQTLSTDPNGDPIHIPQTHTYYLSNTFSSSVSAIVSYYQMGISDPSVYTISLNLTTPPMESSIYNQTNASSLSGYFQELHLVGTRMFGPNNDILYMFESINPNFVIPALVNWQTRPIVNTPNISQGSYRPYRLLAPFENPNLVDINVGTDLIKFPNVGVKYNPDNGGQ